ncbi:MAG: tetratricopeptide repeat protein [Candidatus Marinimicrobia bacterium]|nr:tetratricopeptide repeat protein [Candidatus Neomarinimicrobiota bacterium]
MSQINLPKIYNPHNQSKKELIENFVVRLDIFQNIFDDIKSSNMKHPEQHYIVQGVRGQGKTTLLLRLAYEIENDPDLNDWLIPVIFSEEQYGITKLYKLWEYIAGYLKKYKGFEHLYGQMENLEFNDDYETNCFNLIKTSLNQNDKKLILFIDNIDELFNKFNKKEHHRLREVLIQSPELRIIGASSVTLEFHYEYDKPFYEFFKMPRLKGLSSDDIKKLLLSLGNYYNNNRIEKIVNNQPGRIEALRRLTNGVIRTIVILYEIFADNINGNAFQDLEKILDDVTPLYKDRMDRLPTQQQEIVDFIALSWDAVSTREISKKTKISSKAVSAQLRSLTKNHIIEKQETDTKNHLYRIAERFFNIWYLMRHGGKKEEQKIKFLTEFLQIWCDEEELLKRAELHLDALEKGELYEKYAFHMSEALRQTIDDISIQYDLIENTKLYLQQQGSSLVKELSPTNSDFEEQALKAKADKGNDEALLNLAYLYANQLTDYQKAEKYYLKAIDKEMNEALYGLARLYQYSLEDYKKAEKYYLKDIYKGNEKTLFDLAVLYALDIEDYKKAEKYYLKAIDKGINGAFYGLGGLYQYSFKDYEKAEKYYLKAIDKGIDRALLNLANLYAINLKDYKKAEKYYLKAIDKEMDEALLNVANLYADNLKNYEKAEKYYRKGIDKGIDKALFNLAYLYADNLKDYEKAEKYYLKAINKGIDKALLNIANLYADNLKNYEKAEKYYLKAYKNGDIDAMNNLAWMLFKKNINKEKALKYANEVYRKKNSSYIVHTYAMILLWNDMIDKALEISNHFLNNKKSFERFSSDIRNFLMLLIAKNQYYSALKIFNNNPFDLKDRYKPVYYALMYFLQDEYPKEYKKMGDELKETVEEIVKKIEEMSVEYS